MEATTSQKKFSAVNVITVLLLVALTLALIVSEVVLWASVLIKNW